MHEPHEPPLSTSGAAGHLLGVDVEGRARVLRAQPRLRVAVARRSPGAPPNAEPPRA